MADNGHYRPSSAVVIAPPLEVVASGHTADELAAAWLLSYSGATRRAYASDLRDWGEWLAGWQVDPLEARRAHVDAYERSLEANGRSKATIARRLASLAGFYRYAVDEAILQRSPVANVRRPKLGDDSQTLGLDRHETRGLIAAARSSSPRDYR